MRSIVWRLRLWRFWRNRFGQRLYRLFQGLGFVAALMVRYEAGPAVDAERPPLPDAFSLDRWRGDDPSIPGDVPGTLEASDVVVGATKEGDLVGYCVLSPRAILIVETGGVVEPDGVYCWDLYVDPAYRGRGLGTGLLWRARVDGIAAEAGTAGAGTVGAGTVEALVAADNEPSRRAFRSADFVPTERLLSLGWAGHTYRRTSSLEGTPET